MVQNLIILSKLLAKAKIMTIITIINTIKKLVLNDFVLFLARLHEVQRAVVVTLVVRVPVPVTVPVTLRHFLEVHSLATTYDRGFKLGP